MNTPVSLLERLRRPEDRDDAWPRFVDLYTPLLFLWARRLGLQAPDAADLVQDVFVKLVQKLPDFRYDQQKSFQAWLSVIVHNEWRNRHRRRVERSLEGIAPELSALIVPPEHAELEEAEYRSYLVHRALELIRPEFPVCKWRAFWEYAMEGNKAEKVAADLSVPLNFVYLSKSRVLSRLRQELDGFFD